MKFEDLKEFPHENELRALHGDKNWRVYFPNGYGVDIVGGPQDTNPIKLPNGQLIRIDSLYGDGINTFEVAMFKHNLDITSPKQAILDSNWDDYDFCENYVSKDRIDKILEKVEAI